MAGDDLISASCIRHSKQVPCHDDKPDDDDEACFDINMRFPYCSSLADSSLLLNEPGVTPQVYTTPWQCAHGTSFCSSIRINAIGCVAMILCLCLIPYPFISMYLARVYPAVSRDGDDDEAPVNQSSFFCFLEGVHGCHKNSQRWTFVPPIVAEFFLAYLWAPFALVALFISLLIYLIFEVASAPASASAPVQQQPPDADARIVVLESLDVEGIASDLDVQGTVRRLQELKRLLSEGLVTMEEYKRRRSAVLECAGCDCASLKAAGFDVKALKSAGFSADVLKECGYEAGALKDAGFSALELKTSFPLASLKQAQFDAASLKAAGFSCYDLKTTGFSCLALKQAGFDCASLKAAGFDVKALKSAGFSANVLKQCGYDAHSLRSAGFDAVVLKRAAFSSVSLLQAGFEVSALKRAGCSVTELKQCLDMFESSVSDTLGAAIQNVAAVGLATGNPNKASFAHILAGAFKNLLAVSVETKYDFPQAHTMKEAIKAAEP
jgi:hypothetical protein